jgi:hypothetical protein
MSLADCMPSGFGTNLQCEPVSKRHDLGRTPAYFKQAGVGTKWHPRVQQFGRKRSPCMIENVLFPATLGGSSGENLQCISHGL